MFAAYGAYVAVWEEKRPHGAESKAKASRGR